jgi:hypothetical protein
MTEPFVDTWHDHTDAKKQEAARAMLAALIVAKKQLKPIMTKADHVVFLQVDAAIAHAEAAGIKAEG